MDASSNGWKIRNRQSEIENLLGLAAEAGGEDFELFAVFGDGSAGNIDSLCTECVADFLVGERFLFVFVTHDFGQGIFDGGVGDDGAIGLRDPGGEEVSKFECSPRGGHIFSIAGAADGCFMEFKNVGNRFHGERFKAGNSFFQKVLLHPDDFGGDAEDGVLPLVDTTDEEFTFGNFFADVFACFCGRGFVFQ